jgi:hypothetical protein
MRLDIVVDALDEVGDLRHEGMVGDISAVRFDGGELPVVEAPG